jgi:hypothetical protein
MPVGNGAVGKTTLARVLDSLGRCGVISEEVIQGVRKTNNLEFEYINTHQTFGNTQFSVTLQFLVPPGQKQSEGDQTGRSFEKVIEIYQTTIRRVDMVLFTYSLTNHESFHDLTYWVDSISRLINDKTNFILLGTHLDQPDKREVTREEINEGLEYLRNEILFLRPTWVGRSSQMEVSSITGQNLDFLLKYLAACVITTQPK